MCLWEYPLPRSTLIVLAHSTEAVARKQPGASSPPAPREHCLLPCSVSVSWGRLRQAARHNVCLFLSSLSHSRSIRPVSVVECSRIVFSFHYTVFRLPVLAWVDTWVALTLTYGEQSYCGFWSTHMWVPAFDFDSPCLSGSTDTSSLRAPLPCWGWVGMALHVHLLQLHRLTQTCGVLLHSSSAAERKLMQGAQLAHQINKETIELVSEGTQTNKILPLGKPALATARITITSGHPLLPQLESVTGLWFGQLLPSHQWTLCLLWPQQRLIASPPIKVPQTEAWALGVMEGHMWHSMWQWEPQFSCGWESAQREGTQPPLCQAACLLWGQDTGFQNWP